MTNIPETSQFEVQVPTHSDQAVQQEKACESVELDFNNIDSGSDNKNISDEEVSDFQNYINEAEDEIDSNEISNTYNYNLNYYSDTKDGKVTGTTQGITGDCWLLSGINGLSYCEKGREILSNALEYHDSYTVVNLEGYGSVEIHDDELSYAKELSQYSSGDDDMLIFELAIEKVLDEVANGNIMFDPDSPMAQASSLVFSADQSGLPTITTGSANELLYFLTGQIGKCVSDYDAIYECLDEFKNNNNKDIVMGASSRIEGKITDTEGKPVILSHPHAYTVKEVQDGVVTITNPWDSRQTINLDYETFASVFSLELTDLSDETSKQNCVSSDYKLDENGDKIFIFDNPKREIKESRDADSGKIASRETHYPEENKTLYEQWQYDSESDECKHFKNLEEKYIDSNTGSEILRNFAYDENGNIYLVQDYICNDNGEYIIKSASSISPDTGKITSFEEYDTQGNIIQSIALE